MIDKNYKRNSKLQFVTAADAQAYKKSRIFCGISNKIFAVKVSTIINYNEWQTQKLEKVFQVSLFMSR